VLRTCDSFLVWFVGLFLAGRSGGFLGSALWIPVHWPASEDF
jgi:hypothetical protein